MIRVTGHRGARELAPENTLAGFALASDLGCHAVELDVQLTRDGRLAVIHDETLDRTTDGSGPVRAHRLAELQQFDAGDGNRIPSLEEVLEFLRPTRLLVQVELKGEGTEVAAPEAVRLAGMTDRVRFTSFYHRRVRDARERLPGVKTGILVDSNPVDPVRMLEAAGADTFHVKIQRLDRRLVEVLHAAGRTVVAMGRIVDAPTVERLIALGVDVIGSDRPDIVIATLRSHGLYEPSR